MLKKLNTEEYEHAYRDTWNSSMVTIKEGTLYIDLYSVIHDFNPRVEDLLASDWSMGKKKESKPEVFDFLDKKPEWKGDSTTLEQLKNVTSTEKIAECFDYEYYCMNFNTLQPTIIRVKK